MQIRLLAATFALTVTAAALADEPVPFSAERSWQIQRIGAPTISPDGATVIAPVTRFDLKDNKGLTDLWLWSTDGKVERALTTHPAFDARNPNKLRAVYGAFAQFNLRNFHAPDGRGYKFLGDAVLRLDRTNPQIAARLATPLTRWRRYDRTRQLAMRAVLEDMAASEGLSKDLYEVVSKSLAGD
jgi:dipeptidyl aminopeptidase/acylaminoacyl peptidase